MQTNNETLKYIPGVCNIGKAELNRRKNGVYLSISLLVVNALVLLILPHHKIWNLTVFLTITYFAISFQQWYYKFCVKFGIKGVFNFGDMGKTFSVEQKEYYQKDRAKAMRMIVTGLLIGLITALLCYIL